MALGMQVDEDLAAVAICEPIAGINPCISMRFMWLSPFAARAYIVPRI
jgi:hypothetical protein